MTLPAYILGDRIFSESQLVWRAYEVNNLFVLLNLRLCVLSFYALDYNV